MNVFGRVLVLYCSAAVLLGGCSNLQQPADEVPVTGPPARLAGSAHRATSSQNTLIYAFPGAYNVSGRGTVWKRGIILGYPSGNEVARFLAPIRPSAACTDNQGDVFVAGYNGAPFEKTTAVIEKYAFGASSPSASVSAGTGDPFRCAVDNTTGNIAVVLQDVGVTSLAVLPNFQGPPTTYKCRAEYAYIPGIAYDSSGDLFCLTRNAYGNRYFLSELASGSTSFDPVLLNLGSRVRMATDLQWDGTYLAVEAIDYGRGKNMSYWPKRIYRLSVAGSHAKVVGTIRFAGFDGEDASASIASDRGIMIAPRGSLSFPHRAISVWNYPAGGRLLARLHAGIPVHLTTVAAPASSP